MATESWSAINAKTEVSIHATLAGGDVDLTALEPAARVSIHATLAGGDGGRVKEFNPGTVFLSTPPSRVATDAAALAEKYEEVSIHATLAGGDRFYFFPLSLFCSFYPRHPRGWRLK